MSISALSSSLVSDLSQQQWQNPFQQIRQDFKELASALQSGDLSDAQTAYSNIQQVLEANQGSSNSNPSSNGSTTLQNDFSALGQALQSGDLNQAQSAFSQLISDFQAARQPGSPGGVGWASQAQDQYVPSGSQTQNTVQEALQDYVQLANDVQSGDLTDAQSAYSSLQQLIASAQSSSGTNASSNGSNTIQTDFTNLGTALQSGSVSQAQGAFSQLQSDLLGTAQPESGSTGTTAQPQSVTTPTSTETPAQQVQQDYAQLADALQSGSLTAAQSAFTALEQALQTQAGSSGNTTSAASSTSSTSSTDPIENDLNALGQALSSGNLTQAQSAFSQLQSDIKSAEQSNTSQSQSPWEGHRAGGHHHHHHHGGGDWATSSSSSSTSATNSSTSSNSSVNLYA